jgi:hypothetical protein
VHPGTQCCGKASVTGDDEDEPACPANACEVAAQSGAIRMVVVAEHDAGKTARKSGHCR